MAVDFKDRNVLEQKLWDSPLPTTREEYLARKDIKRELSKLDRDLCRTTKKAGYANLKKLCGKVSGYMNNGMQ